MIRTVAGLAEGRGASFGGFEVRYRSGPGDGWLPIGTVRSLTAACAWVRRLGPTCPGEWVVSIPPTLPVTATAFLG